MRFAITRAETEEQFDRVKALFGQYAQSLEFDLEFQGFNAEVAWFPGDYAPPDGCILIATHEGNAVGCVALRKIDSYICEMKRLYVDPSAQRHGLGRKLALRVIEEARYMGYGQMRLDTVPSMRSAIVLYRALGFREIPPYRHNPIAGAQFMELSLEPPPTRD